MQGTILEKLMENLAVQVRPFAICQIGRGWRLSLEPADSIALHYILSGEGTFRYPEGESQISSGHLIVVPKQTKHAVEVMGEGNVRMATADSSQIPPGADVVAVNTDDSDEGLSMACGRVEVIIGATHLFDELRHPLIEDFSSSPLMQEVFEALIEEEHSGSLGRTAMTTALMTQCFVMLLRRIGGRIESELPWVAALEVERLARVVSMVLDDPGRPYTVEFLAEQAGMSRSSFIEKFTRAFGRSAGDFVRESRLRSGAELLRQTKLPVKNVAMRVGYSSRSHFTHAFAKEFGVSPAAYRSTPVLSF